MVPHFYIFYRPAAVEAEKKAFMIDVAKVSTLLIQSGEIFKSTAAIFTQNLRRLPKIILILVDKLIFSHRKRCVAKFLFLLDPGLAFLSEGELAAGFSATAVQICGEPRFPGHPGL
jgi:hypothetical protein